jgi:hypothetical protein
MFSKWPKWLLCGAVAALPLLAAPEAHATLISGTASFTDSTSGNDVNFTGSFSPASGAFSFNAASGTPGTINNFLKISETDSFNPIFFGTEFASDTLKIGFSITQPSAGNGSVTGSGSASESFFFFALISADGSIHWNGPADIALANGDDLKITLSDGQFDPTARNASAYIDLTYLYTAGSSPTGSVPEPGTLALFGAGLLGLGYVTRRANRA